MSSVALDVSDFRSMDLTLGASNLTEGDFVNSAKLDLCDLRTLDLCDLRDSEPVCF